MSDLPISVVVPSRNEASCIARCLASLRAQDFPREQFEIVVVDNGSSDGTADLARQSGARVIDEPRPGVAAARNAGIRAAKGGIIAFIDADCVAESGWLRELLAVADDTRVGCFVGDILPLNPGEPISDFILDRRLICQERLLSYSPPVAAGGNIAYRREVFEAIGLFDETFVAGEDGDLFWRLVKSDRYHVRFQRRAKVYHPHPSGVGVMLRRARLEGRGLAQFRLKHRSDVPDYMTSLRRTAVGFLTTLGGCLAYPLRVRSSRKAGYSLGRSLAYPFLDKAYSISRTSGVLCELVRARRRQGDRI